MHFKEQVNNYRTLADWFLRNKKRGCVEIREPALSRISTQPPYKLSFFKIAINRCFLSIKDLFYAPGWK